MRRVAIAAVVDSASGPHGAVRTPSFNLHDVPGLVEEGAYGESQTEDFSNCRSLPFTLLFWLVFSVTQIGHRQANLQNSMQFMLKGVLETSRTLAETSTNGTVAVEGRRLLSGSAGGASRPRSSEVATSQSLETVTSISSIWDWLSQSYVPQLWDAGPQGRGVLYDFTRAVGGVRLQQQRLKSGPCPGTPALHSIFNLTCYAGGSGTSTTDSLTTGIWAKDGLETYWLDLAHSEDAVQAEIANLREAAWLAGSTQRLFVHSVFLNAQIKLLALAEASFELDRSGLITTRAAVNTLPTEVYGRSWLVWTGDMLLLVMLAGLAVREGCLLFKAFRSRSERRCTPMRVLKWVVILTGTAFSSFFGYLSAQLEALAVEIASTSMPSAEEASTDWRARQTSLEVIFNEVFRLSGLLRAAELSAFWYGLLVMLLIFEAFEGNPRLAVITETLRQCFREISHFLIVFLLIFFNFTIGAYFLFGHQLKEWSNVIVSMNSAFRALMGDFDFQAMFAIVPVSSVVWFWLFMGLIFLIMLNMLLVIILETYSQVKEANHNKRTLWAQADEIRKFVSTTLRNRLSIKSSLKNNKSVLDPETPTDTAPSPSGSPRSQARRSTVGFTTELQELSARVGELSGRLAEVQNLPRLFKQLEDTCWRYFWLEASGKHQSREHLLSALTDSMPLPSVPVSAEGQQQPGAFPWFNR